MDTNKGSGTECDGTCPPLAATMGSDCDGTCPESAGGMSLAEAMGQFYAPLLEGGDAHQTLMRAQAAFQDTCERNSKSFAQAREAASVQLDQDISALTSTIGVFFARVHIAETWVKAASTTEALSTAGDTDRLQILAEIYNTAVAKYETVFAGASDEDKADFEAEMTAIGRRFEARQAAASEALEAAGLEADAVLAAAYAAHAAAEADQK